MSDSTSSSPRRGTPRGRKGKGTIPLETKAEMVAALPAFNNCKSEVARQFGVSADVVERAANNPAIAEIAEIKKEEIGKKLGQLVDKLTQKFIELADGATLDNKAAVLLGIAADKHRLYTDQPTSITENRTEIVLKEKAEALLESLLPEFSGDRTAALAAMRENAPTLSQYVA